MTAPTPRAVAAVLDSVAVPALVSDDAVQRAQGETTRLGVIRAIATAARDAADAEVRFAMERLAGSYLAA